MGEALKKLGWVPLPPEEHRWEGRDAKHWFMKYFVWTQRHYARYDMPPTWEEQRVIGYINTMRTAAAFRAGKRSAWGWRNPNISYREEKTGMRPVTLCFRIDSNAFPDDPQMRVTSFAAALTAHVATRIQREPWVKVLKQKGGDVDGIAIKTLYTPDN